MIEEYLLNSHRLLEVCPGSCTRHGVYRVITLDMTSTVNGTMGTAHPGLLSSMWLHESRSGVAFLCWTENQHMQSSCSNYTKQVKRAGHETSNAFSLPHADRTPKCETKWMVKPIQPNSTRSKVHSTERILHWLVGGPNFLEMPTQEWSLRLAPRCFKRLTADASLRWLCRLTRMPEKRCHQVQRTSNLKAVGDTDLTVVFGQARASRGFNRIGPSTQSWFIHASNSQLWVLCWDMRDLIWGGHHIFGFFLEEAATRVLTHASPTN